MQGRDFLSAHRSLQRYVSTVLPEPWDVQPARKEPQTRPLAVVRPLGANPSTGTAYVREYSPPFEVLLYPPTAGEGEPWSNEQVAHLWFRKMFRAIEAGHGDGPDKGYSMRIPLYDYTGVPMDSGLPSDAIPIDYLCVQGLDGMVRQDPQQDDLYTVAIDFRLNWRDDGDLSRFDGATLQGIGLRGPNP